MDKIVNKILKLVTEAKKNIDPKLKVWISDRYGPWDERDFISDDGDTYFKYESTSDGGGISHTIIQLPSFTELVKQLKATKDAANNLVRGESVRDDEVLRSIANELRLEFNKFRTHLRKEYPAFYSQLKGQLTEEDIDEMSTSGAAGAFLTPYAFRKPKKKQEPIPESKSIVKVGDILTKDGKKGKVVKVMDDMANVDFGNGDVYGITFSRIKGNKIIKESHTDVENKKLKVISKELKAASKMHKGQAKKIDKIVKEDLDLSSYGYKLVPKNKAGNYVQKGSKLDVKQLFEDQKDYQESRIAAFDTIEQEMNDIYKMLSNAKNETSEYYNDNPSSYTVIKPTDLVLDYIKDIKNLLKGE